MKKATTILLVILFSGLLGVRPAAAVPNSPPSVPVLISPEDGTTRSSIPTVLEALVSDPNGDLLDVTFYVRSNANSGDDFSIIVLPDTQFYSYQFPEIFTSQTTWIHDNQASENIVAVAHLGDLVENNVILEWERAAYSMSILGTTLPFGASVGNHDQSPHDNPDGSTAFYNTYFGVNVFSTRPYYGGHRETANNDDSFILFSASGIDFLMFFLEYRNWEVYPSPDLITWLTHTIDQYPSRQVIIVTHGLMTNGSTIYPIWYVLYDAVKVYPNMMLMLCGHIVGERKISNTYNGHTIHTILSDYQNPDTGGNGWLRQMVFKPSQNLMQVYTYSPWLDQYETDSNSQFSLPVDLRPSFTNRGMLLDVPSGTIASLSLDQLYYQMDYEWFVSISDGVDTVSSPVWSFTTRAEFETYLPLIDR